MLHIQAGRGYSGTGFPEPETTNPRLHAGCRPGERRPDSYFVTDLAIGAAQKVSRLAR